MKRDFGELWAKGNKILKNYGPSTLVKEIYSHIVDIVLGYNFPKLIFHISYKRLWGKVFESYYSRSFVVFAIRFTLVFLFGWIVLFLPKRPFETQSAAEVKKWFRRYHKKVTVVIPTYNDYKLTKNCVESIKSLTSGRYVDIVIVDDGSTAEIQEKLKSLNLPAKLILKKENEGFARTCNAGMEAVSEGDIILLNNDTLVQDGWIEGLQYYAYVSREIGIVGPKLLYDDGSIQWAGSHRNTDSPEWFDHNFRFHPHNYGPANVPIEVLSVTGACMYIKRKVVDAIGILDPKFEMAFEDVDYCLRAWEAGFVSYYAPIAVVTHLESKTRGKKQGGREIRSLEYFWRKWKDWFDNRELTDEQGKLRVIYVMQDTGVAGGHKVVFEHLNGLIDAGFAAELYTISKPPRWFDLKAPVKTFRNYQLLEQDLKEQRAIKVATWWETARVVWRSSVLKGLPVFFVQDIETSYYLETEPVRHSVIAWYKKEFNYLTTSDWNQKQLGELGLKSEIVSPAIEQSTFKLKNIKRDKNTVLAVGRSHPLKNLAFTIKALKKVASPYKLLLFGIEPSLGKKLKCEYIFDPSNEGVADLYNRATIFIQTSRHEGFSLPILEAMACGAVVICTNADGNMDFCKDKENCIIVEQDDVEALKNAIELLLADESLRKRLSERGLETAKRYNWQDKNEELRLYFEKFRSL